MHPDYTDYKQIVSDQQIKIFHLTEENRLLEATIEKIHNKNHQNFPPSLKQINSHHKAEIRLLEGKINDIKLKNNDLLKENNENSRVFSEEKQELKKKIKELLVKISEKSEKIVINSSFFSNLKEAYSKLNKEKLGILSVNSLGLEETLMLLNESVEETVKYLYTDTLKRIESVIRDFHENKALNDEEKDSILSTFNEKRTKFKKFKEEWKIWIDFLKEKSL